MMEAQRPGGLISTLGVAWDTFRLSPLRRKGLIASLLLACLWFGIHGLHDSLWSYRYWKVDPWALQSPVQWPVVGKHGRHLKILADELRDCLEPGAKVAVQAPAEWQGQSFYLFMWLAYAFPEQHVLPVIDPEDLEQADYLLAYFGDGRPGQPPPGMDSLCSGDRATLYRQIAYRRIAQP